jgi:hypothetical protein
MPTARYSSLWDRLRGDHASYSATDWEAWLQTNYPDAVARTASGGYVSAHGNPRSWQICPATLAEIIWVYQRGILSAAQARAIFSFSDHEAAQIGDVQTWLNAAGTANQQILRWRDLGCIMDMIEQRAIESKTYLYNMAGIRADAASG